MTTKNQQQQRQQHLSTVVVNQNGLDNKTLANRRRAEKLSAIIQQAHCGGVILSTGKF